MINDMINSVSHEPYESHELCDAIAMYNQCQHDQIYIQALHHILDMYYISSEFKQYEPRINTRIVATHWRKVGSHANKRMYAVIWCYRFTNIKMSSLVEHFDISDKTIMRYVVNSYKPKFKVFGLYIDEKIVVIKFNRADKLNKFTSQQINTIISQAPNMAKSFIKKYYELI